MEDFILIGNYANVLTETYEIFQYLSTDILEKIPENLKKEIKKNRNIKYQFKYYLSKSLAEQKILQETKDLISAIYLMYCCDNEEKQELLKICKENEIRYREDMNKKHCTDNIFKQKEMNKNISKELIEIPKESWYEKILNKIKKIIKNLREKF